MRRSAPFQDEIERVRETRLTPASLTSFGDSEWKQRPPFYAYFAGAKGPRLWLEHGAKKRLSSLREVLACLRTSTSHIAVHHIFSRYLLLVCSNVRASAALTRILNERRRARCGGSGRAPGLLGLALEQSVHASRLLLPFQIRHGKKEAAREVFEQKDNGRGRDGSEGGQAGIKSSSRLSKLRVPVRFGD
jgi:hypothetical protein